MKPPTKDHALPARSSGVTLIELVIVIVLTSILAALMTSFFVPMFSYSEARRRAEMTDTADTAARRFGRDLRLALPNSVRVSADNKYIEFLLVRTGGRYRRDTCGGGGCGGTVCPTVGGSPTDSVPDALRFGATDSCFKTIGTIPNDTAVAASDYVVVYNLPPGTVGADAYETGNASGGNKAQVSGLTVESAQNQERIAIQSTSLTYESPASRFHIIEGAVTYGCSPNPATPSAGTLTRYSGYGIVAGTTPPALATLQTGSSGLVANQITACTFTYDPNTVAGADGLVTLSISLASQGLTGNTESVTLYYSFHVSNLP